jgi:Ca-activated chloride channel family protein
MRAILGLTAVVCALGPVRPAAAGERRAGVGSFLGEGSLVANRDGQVVKVPLKHTRVELTVAGQLASARVRQRFENPYAEKIEASYLFPLPTGAAVRRFELRSGERRVRGRLLPRGEARAVFRRASEAGKVAALLEQERPNLFVQTIANLEPGKTVEVELEYVEPLRIDESGGLELVFPMVVGPRFVPRAKEHKGRPAALLSPPVLPPAFRSGHEIDLRVSVTPGVPIEELSSPSHGIRSRRLGTSRAELTLAADDRIPNKDFVLRYRVAGGTPRAGVLTCSRGGGEGHLLLTLQPPAPAAAARAKPSPRELIFLLDTSSSMTGAPLVQGKALVRRMLERLASEDSFQIVRFEERVESLGPRLIAARPANVALALRWLDSLRARGGTLVGKGLEHALALPHDPARLRILVVLSDGYIGDEETILRAARSRLGAARIFVFGIGTATNRYLLEELATLGRGAVQVLRADEPAAPAVERFVQRISRPLLTDLSLEVRGIAVREQSPARIPDLFAGQPLQLLGRYRGSGRGEAILRGRSAGAPVAIRIPLTVPAGAHGPEGVALAWARARIAEEERGLLATRADRDGIRRRVLELSLRHGILTRYTSFVAVDEDSHTRGGSLKVVVPVDRPDGLLRALHGAGGTGHGAGGVGYGTIGLGTFGVIGKGGGGAGFGRATLGYRTAAAPLRISVGTTVVMGSLDKEILRRVMRSHANEVRYCYERELASRPGLAGKVTVTFTIAPNGVVVSSSIQQSTLAAPGVETCIAQAVRRWSFPSVEGGGIVVVTYPYLFRPAEARPRSVVAPYEGERR